MQTGVSHGAKLLWARLAKYLGKEGGCYPSMATLAAALGMSAAQCRRYVAELVGHGLLRVIHRRDERGDPDSNAYELLWQPMLKAKEVLPNMQVPYSQICKDGTPENDRRGTPESDHQRGSSSREKLIGSSEESPRTLSIPSASVEKAEGEPTGKNDSLFADDDSRPKTESEREAYLLKLLQARHPKADALKIVIFVADELRKRGGCLRDFLELDARETTNPSALTNPTGHYRKLARSVGPVRHRPAEGEPTGPVEPLPVAEADRCAHCGLRKGKGIVIIDGHAAHCPECVTYRQGASA
jgi:hypothetical protein